MAKRPPKIALNLSHVKQNDLVFLSSLTPDTITDGRWNKLFAICCEQKEKYPGKNFCFYEGNGFRYDCVAREITPMREVS